MSDQLEIDVVLTSKDVGYECNEQEIAPYAQVFAELIKRYYPDAQISVRAARAGEDRRTRIVLGSQRPSTAIDGEQSPDVADVERDLARLWEETIEESMRCPPAVLRRRQGKNTE